MTNERRRLRHFLHENIPFTELKQVGFFDKSVRKTDYEKISEKICYFFGFKSVYEYGDIMKKKTDDENYSVDFIDLISELRNLN